jgi:hypothetical protein
LFLAVLSRRLEIEVSGFEVNHGDEVLDVAKASGPAFDLLNSTIDAFHGP